MCKAEREMHVFMFHNHHLYCCIFTAYSLQRRKWLGLRVFFFFKRCWKEIQNIESKHSSTDKPSKKSLPQNLKAFKSKEWNQVSRLIIWAFSLTVTYSKDAVGNFCFASEKFCQTPVRSIAEYLSETASPIPHCFSHWITFSRNSLACQGLLFI